MTHPIVYDSLLVHYLARELHERLAARRLRRVRFDSDARRFVLELDEERLVWELHPTRGWIRVVRDPPPGADDPGPGVRGGSGGSEPAESAHRDVARAAAEGWGGRRIRTQRRPRVRRVTAPPDERLLEIEIDAGGPDRASRFVVELMTNQWNVLALDPAGTIVSALWSRTAGRRSLRSGEPYVPPGGGEPREGVEGPVPLDRFVELVAPEASTGDPARALIRSLAWTSPINVGAILGEEDPTESRGRPEGGDESGDEGEERWRGAWESYAALAERPDPRPRVMDLRGGIPYPLPLPGVAGRTSTSLLAAMEAAAAREVPPGVAPEVRSALEDRLDRVARRAKALRAEAESAPEKAAVLRRRADLLMARLHELVKGRERVELDDFEGGTEVVELDPALTPVENAERLYDQAKRRERAAERLPDRVREALAEQNRLEALLDSLASGSADPEELARWVEEVRPDRGPGDGGDDADRLPYRRFRSSGGLEIRVGRSGRANDELTFHHSAPDDIWLHARDVAGAHVILRWGNREQNPPHRDLLEAAVLAAVASKARTSGTVPVDWTRRKYVRSPRNAPPGVVIPDRVSTVFVEPDPAVEDRLRP